MCAQGWRPGSDKGCTFGVYADGSTLPWDKLEDDMMRVAVSFESESHPFATNMF